MSVAPDIVVIGASRAGSTILTSRLTAHPRVVPPSVKEPNYYSLNHDRGEEWYASLFPPRGPADLFLDASTTYSYPEYAVALERVTRRAPDAVYVYLVRQPVERAYSQFVHETLYLDVPAPGGLAAALHRDSHFMAPSRYGLTLTDLASRVDQERILVVPFEVVVHHVDAVADAVLRAVGAEPALADGRDARTLHQNQRVVMRSPRVRSLFNRMRDSRAYPPVRRLLGESGVRQLRGLLTSSDGIQTLDEALCDVDAAALAEADAVFEESRRAVTEWLVAQDARTGLSWSSSPAWLASQEWRRVASP